MIYMEIPYHFASVTGFLSVMTFRRNPVEPVRAQQILHEKKVAKFTNHS